MTISGADRIEIAAALALVSRRNAAEDAISAVLKTGHLMRRVALLPLQRVDGSTMLGLSLEIQYPIRIRGRRGDGSAAFVFAFRRRISEATGPARPCFLMLSSGTMDRF